MSKAGQVPNRARLKRISGLAALIGLTGGAVFYFEVSAYNYNLNWVWWLILGMLSVIIYSISFYFGHRYFEDSLDQYIVSDTFGRKHDWIDVETETRESGDPKIDAWVAHYKFIRIMFAMGLLPLIVMIYIVFFA